MGVPLRVGLSAPILLSPNQYLVTVTRYFLPRYRPNLTKSKFGLKDISATIPNARTKLYIQTALKASKDQEGFSVAEYTWGDSTNYAKLDGQTFPLTANVSLDIVSTGKSNQVIITDVALKPIK